MSAATRIAVIKLSKGDTAGANEILNTVERSEQECLDAGHGDWTHYLRLGDVSAIRQNFEQAHIWYIKAVRAGYYYQSEFELDPSLSEYRKTTYYEELVDMIKTELQTQRAYIEIHSINKFSFPS